MKTIEVKDNSYKWSLPVKVNRVCQFCKELKSDVNNFYCSTCQHWTDTRMADLVNQDGLIINGQHYRLNTKDGMFNFGGQVFHILRKNARKVEAVYLSHQGTIPEGFLKYETFQDNAIFVEGIK